MSKTYKEFIKEYDMGMTVPTMAYLKPTPSMKLRRKENIISRKKHKNIVRYNKVKIEYMSVGQKRLNLFHIYSNFFLYLDSSIHKNTKDKNHYLIYLIYFF